MVVHVCNPQLLGRLKPEDCKFELSLGNIVRPNHKKTKQKKQERKRRLEAWLN
jgi:hypothetical protein